jgi:SAM-dependent methyltransferase
MPDWDSLFRQGRHIARFPQTEVLEFLDRLEAIFAERPLRLWDLCCGAGRHTLLLAQRGHSVFASDASSSGIDQTRELLGRNGVTANLAVADMARSVWPEVRYHGVVAWDCLHHNRAKETSRSIALVHQQLIPGGLFLATLKTTKADSCGCGHEIEPGTYVRDTGDESGVPHHYYDEAEVRALFAEWDLLVLVEQIMDYRERGPDFLKSNPFAYSRWGILARTMAASG